jgi:hypothetical protein
MQRASEREMRSMKIARSLADVAAVLTPGALGIVLFAILSKPLAGAATPEGDVNAVPPVCVGWHRGDGESQAFDLARTERGYQEFTVSLAQSLSKALRDQTAKAGPVGYDAGLRACGRSQKRTATPAQAVPESLRGRRLWFFAFTPGMEPRVPDEAQGDPDVVPLVTKIEKVEDLAKLSKLIGRPATLAPKGLGEALGLRCVPALVAISKEGEVEIHEDP